ncbi:hypothetical protein BT96DRAFT_302693 [Gymnopus androsaceus JB14]|uniref:Uncharacterized protein n=1 Tax=Gymnopus androsaceus JB14 TaxID=1447944 RepID=A0A6A4H1I7_9AGAR|nr:hypothetical protein BT96DRAFT_302693 [Gymnopus androsaceus JB14]
MNLHQTLPRDTAMLNVNVRKKIDFWPVQKPAILLKYIRTVLQFHFRSTYLLDMYILQYHKLRIHSRL